MCQQRSRIIEVAASAQSWDPYPHFADEETVSSSVIGHRYGEGKRQGMAPNAPAPVSLTPLLLTHQGHTSHVARPDFGGGRGLELHQPPPRMHCRPQGHEWGG